MECHHLHVAFLPDKASQCLLLDTSMSASTKPHTQLRQTPFSYDSNPLICSQYPAGTSQIPNERQHLSTEASGLPYIPTVRIHLHLAKTWTIHLFPKSSVIPDLGVLGLGVPGRGVADQAATTTSHT
ncbi:hypothetical protein TNCV_4568171 [Trichonephila clavipes]|nr:hypothetical protein TNCV_4568171 [Trichonephila clavipes]